MYCKKSFKYVYTAILYELLHHDGQGSGYCLDVRFNHSSKTPHTEVPSCFIYAHKG